MQRRRFLKALGLGAVTVTGVAAGVVDPETLLWTPGQRTHFLPPASGWAHSKASLLGWDWGYQPSKHVMAAWQNGDPNTLLTVDWTRLPVPPDPPKEVMDRLILELADRIDRAALQAAKLDYERIVRAEADRVLSLRADMRFAGGTQWCSLVNVTR